MEGPSLFLAKEQLKPFKKKVVVGVAGNTRIDKGRFKGQIVKDIFSWGKHLLFQFDGFALKVHFLVRYLPRNGRGEVCDRRLHTLASPEAGLRV